MCHSGRKISGGRKWRKPPQSFTNAKADSSWKYDSTDCFRLSFKLINQPKDVSFCFEKNICRQKTWRIMLFPQPFTNAVAELCLKHHKIDCFRPSFRWIAKQTRNIKAAAVEKSPLLSLLFPSDVTSFNLSLQSLSILSVQDFWFPFFLRNSCDRWPACFRNNYCWPEGL